MRVRNQITALVVLAILCLVISAYAEKRDITGVLSVETLIPPDTYNSDQSTLTTGVDVSQFGGTAIVISTGSGSYDASNGLKFYLAEADYPAAGSYSAFLPADYTGETTNASNAILAILASQTTPRLAKFGYLGSKRYLKLTIDVIGTATNTCSAIAVRGLPHIAPITGN